MMENREKRIKIISAVWLILVQIVSVLSVMLWFIGWAMAMGDPNGSMSVLFVFLTSYPVFVIASIIMGWVSFARKRYIQLIVWSILPVGWWLSFMIIGYFQ